jgi:hypothetical protein
MHSLNDLEAAIAHRLPRWQMAAPDLADSSPERIGRDAPSRPVRLEKRVLNPPPITPPGLGGYLTRSS